MGARSRKLTKAEYESAMSGVPGYQRGVPMDEQREHMREAQQMRKDLGPRPYGAPPRFAGDDPWLSPETWPAPPYRGGDKAFRDWRQPNRNAW